MVSFAFLHTGCKILFEYALFLLSDQKMFRSYWIFLSDQIPNQIGLPKEFCLHLEYRFAIENCVTRQFIIAVHFKVPTT